MNKLLATMAAVSAIAIAAPAAAQYGGNNRQNDVRASASADVNLTERMERLQSRLQAGVQSGAITRREAMPLRQQLRQLASLERQYARDGISGQERGDLQRRMRDLRQAIRAADGNDQARWDGYDREDGYGRYDQAGRSDRYDRDQRMDNDRDGYDDRDYDRDGRWDDDVRDGRYQQPAQGGIGGLVDALVGGGGLRVGQRASSDLYGLPSGYRDQYRDGNGAYYRTDGRQIYQIDSRTQLIARIYSMRR